MHKITVEVPVALLRRATGQMASGAAGALARQVVASSRDCSRCLARRRGFAARADEGVRPSTEG